MTYDRPVWVTENPSTYGHARGPATGRVSSACSSRDKDEVVAKVKPSSTRTASQRAPRISCRTTVRWVTYGRPGGPPPVARRIDRRDQRSRPSVSPRGRVRLLRPRRPGLGFLSDTQSGGLHRRTAPGDAGIAPGSGQGVRLWLSRIHERTVESWQTRVGAEDPRPTTSSWVPLSAPAGRRRGEALHLPLPESSGRRGLDDRAVEDITRASAQEHLRSTAKVTQENVTLREEVSVASPREIVGRSGPSAVAGAGPAVAAATPAVLLLGNRGGKERFANYIKNIKMAGSTSQTILNAQKWMANLPSREASCLIASLIAGQQMSTSLNTRRVEERKPPSVLQGQRSVLRSLFLSWEKNLSLI